MTFQHDIYRKYFVTFGVWEDLNLWPTFVHLLMFAILDEEALQKRGSVLKIKRGKRDNLGVILHITLDL